MKELSDFNVLMICLSHDLPRIEKIGHSPCEALHAARQGRASLLEVHMSWHLVFKSDSPHLLAFHHLLGGWNGNPGPLRDGPSPEFAAHWSLLPHQSLSRTCSQDHT